MAYTATHRHAQISARKVRPLADLIRGKRVDEALALLKYQPQRGARMLEKVLQSALGNADDRRAPNLGGLRIVDARTRLPATLEMTIFAGVGSFANCTGSAVISSSSA